MDLSLADVDIWWRLSDCVDFYSGVVHQPTCQEYSLGLFIFSMWILWHLRSLISGLLYMSAQDILGIYCSCLVSSSLSIPGDINFNALGVPWFPQLVSLENCLAYSRRLQNSAGLIYHRKDYLRFSDRICKLEVLFNSCPSALTLALVAGHVIDLRQQRRKVNFLAVTIHHPSCLLFLTCLWVLWSQCTTHV